MSNFIIPKYNFNGIFLRKIRSFVCRNNRCTQNKLDIIKKNWSYIGINFQNKVINLKQFFHKKNAPIILEIGFGSGESLIHTAYSNLDKNILGIEVYTSGISTCIKKIYISQINNVKIIFHDAVEVLKYMISDYTLHTIQLFFPDPWPKLRHNKRRILQESFVKLVLKKIILGGILYIVTDCKLYADSIIIIMNKMIGYIKRLNNYNNFFRPNIHIMTKFEKKAYLSGNQIFHLIFQCIKNMK